MGRSEDRLDLLETIDSRDEMTDFDGFLEAYSVDEADKPQFDILYQLRRVLDPIGNRDSQEHSITDGRGRPVYGSRSAVGPVVDLHYRTGKGTRMNLEVDLDSQSQRQHRREHLRAMQTAYERWIRGGQRGRNPMEGLASIFVSAQKPTRRGQAGRITEVRQVQYRAGRDGRVRPVTTGWVRQSGGARPEMIARHPIFSVLGRLPPIRARSFDAFGELSPISPYLG
ncbi:hypothetical protein [Methylocaldum szegediense]|uniref:Uncharacterized protein n=1 Tax=Methylocaldum szegediense TaxID=73780 RepID=A0ABM9HXQ6_9GAMM|nr:hypothetical protein [Methylocaldum szegediense]CAI8755976.1 protein of unknown function [Methylocaldum szegediense]